MKKVFLVAILVATFQSCSKEKTAYVDSRRVVSEFSGMKAVEAKWTKINDDLRKELEDKAKNFQKEVQDFQAAADKMRKKKLEETRMELGQKQQALQREQQTRSQKLQEQSGLEIDSIVKHVKEYVKDYGKKNGYTYIYGDTEVGNILYAKKELDITESVLEGLNGKKSVDSTSVK